MTTKAQEALKLLTRPQGCTNSELAKVLGRSRANVKGYARRRWKLAMKVEKAETRYTADGKPGEMVVPPRKRKSKAKPETVESVKKAGDPGPQLLAELLPRVGGKTPKRLATPAELAAKKAEKRVVVGNGGKKPSKADAKALADVPASLRLKPIAKQETLGDGVAKTLGKLLKPAKRTAKKA